MSEQVMKILVAGVYNWKNDMTKQDRIDNPEYDRYLWLDIDQLQPYRLEAVLKILEDNKISCIVQRVGRGWHIFADLVNFTTLKHIRTLTKDYVDPRAGTCLRITRKSEYEVWQKPVWYNFGNYSDRPNWVKAISYFLCREQRHETESYLKIAVQKCGLNKYWQPAYYPVEVRRQ